MTESNLGLEILQEVTLIANSTLDLDETLEQIIPVIKNKMHMDACAIYLINESDGLLHLKASMGLPDEARHINLEIGQGVTGWVAQQGTSLALSEAMQDPRFVYFPEIEEEKFSSMLSVPILADCPLSVSSMFIVLKGECSVWRKPVSWRPLPVRSPVV